MEHGFAFAGANAYRVNKIISVKELVDTLDGEYTAAAMAQPIAIS
jgi:nitronate monooxygenase